MKKILILSANPKHTDRLRLDEEAREIQAGLERSKKRKNFQVITRWAVRVDDLRRALLDVEPQIVHFSGHGTGSDGLALENNEGKMQLVSTDSLALLFELFKDKVECILLNACYSEVQAEAIYKHISCVIGMSQTIQDEAALNFARGFYDALLSGRSYEEAYKFGCVNISLNGIAQSSVPVIKNYKNSNLQLLNNKEITEEVQEQILVKNNFINTAIESKDIRLENPEGTVPIDSPFYITRPPIESDCYEEVLKGGALIRIKAPRQLGKTSLVTRILHHAKHHDCQTVYLNFQAIDAEFFSNLAQLLQWLCLCVTEGLNLPDKLGDYWKEDDRRRSSKNKCTNYFERYLLEEVKTPIVLGLDEVDEVFKHPDVASDFFALLRFWHETAKNELLWRKLRLIIVHSKEVYIPLNITQSPFNVGLPIELPDLTTEQTQNLIQRHGLSLNESEFDKLRTLVGGHPYLVRVALYQLARGRITLEELLQIAPTEEGPYSDHLRRHLRNLEEDEELVIAIKKVINANVPVDVGSLQAFRLRSMGLVNFKGNKVIPLCDLYTQYLCSRLR
jgi:hypothetical protein